MTIRPGALYRATITIWSRYDSRELELSDLAQRAESGDAYCSSFDVQHVESPESDPSWDGTEFFDHQGEEE